MPNKFRDLFIAKPFKGRDGVDKTSWIKVGRMLFNTETENITIFLDVLPAHGESILAFKPKEKSQNIPTVDYSEQEPIPTQTEPIKPSPTDIPF